MELMIAIPWSASIFSEQMPRTFCIMTSRISLTFGWLTLSSHTMLVTLLLPCWAPLCWESLCWASFCWVPLFRGLQKLTWENHRFERLYLGTTWFCQQRIFLVNWCILPEQLIDLKEFFKAALTSMHSLIWTTEMNGILFQIYDIDKNKNI